MTNIYVHQDLHEMNLYPCAYSMTFNVTKEKGSDKLTLNGILNQRSQDVRATGFELNVCQISFFHPGDFPLCFGNRHRKTVVHVSLLLV